MIVKDLINKVCFIDVENAIEMFMKILGEEDIETDQFYDDLDVTYGDAAYTLIYIDQFFDEMERFLRQRADFDEDCKLYNLQEFNVAKDSFVSKIRNDTDLIIYIAFNG